MPFKIIETELRGFASNTFSSKTKEELETPLREEIFSIAERSKIKCLPTFGTTLKSGSKEFVYIKPKSLRPEKVLNTTSREQEETTIIIKANLLILFTMVFSLLAKKYLRAILNVKLLNIFTF